MRIHITTIFAIFRRIQSEPGAQDIRSHLTHTLHDSWKFPLTVVSVCLAARDMTEYKSYPNQESSLVLASDSWPGVQWMLVLSWIRLFSSREVERDQGVSVLEPARMKRIPHSPSVWQWVEFTSQNEFVIRIHLHVCPGCLLSTSLATAPAIRLFQ